VTAVEVSLLPVSAADDAALLADLRDRINAAYAEAEEELWVPGTDRIAADRVAEIVAAGELAVARVDSRVVGSVRVRRLDDGTGFFGLLAVHPDDQGLGVGRELVRFAEDLMREAGASEMELRLLVPRAGSDPGKEGLHGWYTRLGYRLTGHRDFAETHPDAVRAMRVPLDIRTYRKRL
jgi:GNAT superfamily N-acetyltransferase